MKFRTAKYRKQKLTKLKEVEKFIIGKYNTMNDFQKY